MSPYGRGRKVFVLGPGYVGREVIDGLLQEDFGVTTLVRRKEAGEELEAAGVTAILGDLEDSALLTKLTVASDVVFHLATADHLESAEAILAGVKQRAANGLSTIYLHQSGASCLSDARDGVPADNLNDKFYSDEKPEELDALPESAPHKHIDRAIIKVRDELKTKAKIFIMMPGIIYGTNSYGRLSIQMYYFKDGLNSLNKIPTLTRFAIKNGYSGYVGEGNAVWSMVHVKDLAKAYMTIVDWLSGTDDAGLQHPYFFCESGEISWKKLAAIIGSELHKAGKIESPQAKCIPKDQYGDLYGEFTADVVGCNARCKSDRLRGLGWTASEFVDDLPKAFVAEDLPALLQEKEFKPWALNLK